MKRIILFLLAALSLTSCSSRKHALAAKPKNETRDTRPARAPEKVITSNTLEKVYSSNGYIERFKGIAINEMNRSGIPASITLAQGLLESSYGNSTLAREANNHFGIKVHSDWQGRYILMDDDARNERFRVYDSAEDSYRDHTEFLKRQRYAFLFKLDKNDYKGWAKGLKQAGYATNPRYPELLIGLIERYGLDRYDRGESLIAKEEREEIVQAQIEVKEKQVASTNQEELQVKPQVNMQIYEVNKGDTLYAISKRFGLTLDDIRMLNSLKSDNLQPGQLLLVSK